MTLLDGTVIDYEYDAVGNRTKKTVTQGSVTTTKYSYDVGNQLTAVDGQALSLPELFVSGIPEITDSWKSAFLELHDIPEVPSSKCQCQ